ncbi:hypothetical protein BGAL_0130g00180 [Botrytis galanthina]|uniref:Uncharacterized protein n=1 Tax=Botrytis galanthina TaxID=278940 RepID=A0A4S8QZM9_9HELO|nr:hypothetical protein BGAL_0130g00180 [Botrytis galanthina]
MELWACGFNAWNQLQFEGDLPDEPEDVLTFKRVLRAEGSIDILETSFSACLETEVTSRVCHMIRSIDIMSENKMAPASGKSVQRYMLEFHLMLKEGQRQATTSEAYLELDRVFRCHEYTFARA